MIIDSHQLPQDEKITSDLCIVGGGPAGITIARELIGTNLRVALVESGGFEFDPDTQSLYEGEETDSWYTGLDATRLRFLGGATNHWDGNCRPLDPIDFEVRPDIPHTGWPLNRSDLIPFYRRAESVCELQAFDYDSAGVQGINGRATLQISPEALLTGVYRRSPPTRFGERYRDELQRAANVDVYLHANVLTLDSNDSATHVTGISASTLDGKKISFEAKTVVLAAGGTENARLLLLSDEIQKEGLGNSNDLVGRYFSDHMNSLSGTFIPLDSEIDVAAYEFDREAYGMLTMPQQRLRAESLLNVTIFLEALAIPAAEGVVAARRMADALADGEVPDNFLSGMGNALLDLDDIALAAYRKVIGRSAPVEKIRLYTRVEPAPNPENRITLGSERDRFGQRRARATWRQSSVEHRSIQRAHELLSLEMGRLALGRVNFSLGSMDGGMPEEAFLSGHHLGTTRMHASAQEGVVDRDCRVHGIDNLYVSGSSVFPTFGCSNPTFTIVALALRLADHLAAQDR